MTFWYSEKNLRTDYLNRIKEIEICVRHVDRVWKAYDHDTRTLGIWWVPSFYILIDRGYIVVKHRNNSGSPLSPFS